jgi:hypothetical protein
MPITTPREFFFDFSTADLDSGLVHLYGFMDLHPLSGDSTTKVWNYSVLVQDVSMLSSDSCLGSAVISLAAANASMTCRFRHKNKNKSTVLVSSVHTFWQKWQSTAVVCMMPPAVKAKPTDYIPSLSSGGRVVTALYPIRALPPRKAHLHRFCMCLTMWRHTRYLLEFLKYHTDVHGLGHTIIISQDRESFEAARWLGLFYSLQVEYWSHIASQVTMDAYCTLLAKHQCEWVGQWDVDEFLLLENSARLPNVLDHLNPSVGVLAIPRHTTQMPAGQVIIRTLPGGVVRNYMCRMTNIHNFKTLNRIDRLHPSFVNGIHDFCPKKGSTSERHLEHQFLHFRHQSWELFRTRYVRNVNLVFDFKSLSEFAIDKPNFE